jgi:hypothetical protein
MKAVKFFFLLQKTSIRERFPKKKIKKITREVIFEKKTEKKKRKKVSLVKNGCN